MAKSRHSTKKVNKKSRKYVCRQRKRTGGTQRNAAAAANAMGKNLSSQAMADQHYRNLRTGIRAKPHDHCCCKLWDALFGGPEGATPTELRWDGQGYQGP